MYSTFLTVFGHTSVDIILKLDSVPEMNASAPVKERIVRWGGTGANISKGAALLGVPTRLVSFVGEDFSDDYRDSLVRSGVNISDLEIIKGQGTPTCYLITLPDETQMALMDQGAMEEADNFQVPEKAVKEAQVVHIGTGDPSYYLRVIEWARKEKKTIAFDPSQELRYLYSPEMFDEMLSKSDIFFCNEEEFSIASKYIGADSPEDFLSRVDVVIMTKGREGSVLHTRDGDYSIQAYTPDSMVDPTGAGDAYRAGFYAGLYRGMPLDVCCSYGACNASQAIAHEGAQASDVTWDFLCKAIGSD